MSVYKHKNGRWYYKFVIDGVQYHRACKGAIDPRSARKCEIEAMDAVCQEGSKYKKKKPITVKEAMERYEKYARGEKDSYKTDLKFIERIIDFFGKNKIFTSIIPSDINAFKHAIKIQSKEIIKKTSNPDYPQKSRKKYIKQKQIIKKELSASTIKKHINAISKTFNLLMADGDIDIMHNPCKSANNPRQDDPHYRVLTKEEQSKIFNAIRLSIIKIKKNTKDKTKIPEKIVHLVRLAQFILCGLHAGLRKTEMFKNRKIQVNMDEKIIKILYSSRYKTKNKGSKYREIPISKQLYRVYVSLFNDSRNKTEWLFVNLDSQQPYTSIDKTFKTILRLAGLLTEEEFEEEDDNKNITLHTLRHTFATRLALNGVDVKTLQELLGHESIETTQIYYHTNIKHKKKAIEIMDKF